jgi:FAD/FMN-containing dehydrogenase
MLLPASEPNRLSRRGFLAGSALTAGALLASRGAVAANGVGPARNQAGVSETEWSRLGKALPGGRLLRPWDADFHLVALPNNLRYASVQPQGIVRCSSARDVAFAIKWARQNGVPLVTRGGGHSYAGYSTTTGLMIETAWMNQTVYDPKTGVLRVRAGARNRNLGRVLRQNNRLFTHGRCASVGIAGFLLGGGIGFNMRGYGLGCDQLLGSEIVLADGTVRYPGARSTDDENVDLFWAMRGGGGGNFGISTGFALQTFSIPVKSVTVFNLSWRRTPDDKGACTRSAEDIGAALMAQLEQASTALGSRISFGAVTPQRLAAGYDVSINLLGQYAGPRAELEAMLRPVYDLCPPNGGAGIREMPYWDGQEFLNEEGYPEYYQERSAFVTRPFGANELAKAFQYLRRWPGTGGGADIRFFQTGGRVNAVKPDGTAIVHRTSRWLSSIGLTWGGNDDHNDAVMRANHDWQDAFYAEMRPLAGGGAFLNFADPSLADYRTAYYGSNLARLTDVKRRIDPDNLFNFPQAI